MWGILETICVQWLKRKWHFKKSLQCNIDYKHLQMNQILVINTQQEVDRSLNKPIVKYNGMLKYFWFKLKPKVIFKRVIYNILWRMNIYDKNKMSVLWMIYYLFVMPPWTSPLFTIFSHHSLKIYFVQNIYTINTISIQIKFVE